jgi:hypothetical protein
VSRRNQTRRRRTYGRRQHEVRERRPDGRDATGFLGEADAELDNEWQGSEALEERTAYGESFGSFSQ